MLTKAIILNRLLDNHYLIRIPLLDSPGDTEISSVEATLSHTPGIIESYKVNDVVIVGFEEHSSSKPIILGKLFTKEEDGARGYAQFESLDVQKSVNLPDNLNIGGMEFKNVSQMFNNIQDVQNSLEDSKQDTLVSGVNIKTINNVSLLGSGNINVGEGGLATDVQINGTSITSSGIANILTQSTYNASSNKIATMSDLSDYVPFTGSNTPVSLGSTLTTGGAITASMGGIVASLGNVESSNGYLIAGSTFTSTYTKINSTSIVHKGFLQSSEVTNYLPMNGGTLATTSDIQTALTSNLSGYTTTALLTIPGETAPNNKFNGAKFTIGTTNYAGLYVFTYGNCMISLPVKDMNVNTVYKLAACLINSSGSYQLKILSYSLDSAGNLYIYDKTNYLATGYTAYLFRLTIY